MTKEESHAQSGQAKSGIVEQILRDKLQSAVYSKKPHPKCHFVFVSLLIPIVRTSIPDNLTGDSALCISTTLCDLIQGTLESKVL